MEAAAESGRRTRLVLRVVVGAMAAGALALLMGACGGNKGSEQAARAVEADEQQVVSFAGEVADTDAFIGANREGEDLIAYVCDGKTISRWFRGKVGTDGAFSLTHPTGDTLVGSFAADGLTGNFSHGGEVRTLRAPLVAAPAGLFRAQDTIGGTPRLGGWIVLTDGRQRGAVQQGDATSPAPPLNPVNGTAGTGDTTLQATTADATPPSTTAPATTAPATTAPATTAPATTTPAPSTAAATSAAPESTAVTTALGSATTTASAATTAAGSPTTSPTTAPTSAVITTAASGSATTTAVGPTTTATGPTTTAGPTTTVSPTTTATGAPCALTALPGRIFDLQARAQPLLVGFPTLGQITLGSITTGGACDNAATIPFANSTAAFFQGFLSGTGLSGTIDSQKTCITGGSFAARADLGLPALTVTDPLCIGYDSTFNAATGAISAAIAGAPPFPSTLGTPCGSNATGSLHGRLRWTNNFPTLQLPAGFTFREGIVDFTCTNIRVAAQVAIAGAAINTATPTANRLIEPAPGTVTINLAANANNSFAAAVDLRAVPILGSPLDVSGTVTGAPTGALTYDIVARLQNATLGIPGFTLKTAEVRFTNTQTTVSGKATAGNGEVALDLNGSYRSEEDWNVALTVDTTDPKGTGTWTPAPTLLPNFAVPRVNFAGVLKRENGPVQFDINAALSAPVTIVANTAVVNTARVRIANVPAPVGCPVTANEPFIDLSGTGRLTIPQAPVVDLAASSCLGLTSGQFRLASTADLNSWKPDPTKDLTVEGFGFEVLKVGDQLRISGDGELKFAQARGLARVEFRSPNTLIVDGGVNMADLQVGGGTGHLILATQPVVGYTNPNDAQLGEVTLVAGLTAVANINLDAGTRTFLTQKLGVPADSVPERLQAKAQIGGAIVQLEAALVFPDDGLQLFLSCPSGQPCNADTQTRMGLQKIFFRVDTTGSLGLGASMKLHLPKPANGRGAASDVTLTGTLSLTAGTTLGLALSMEGTLNNALGIEGFVLRDVAIQGALNFAASGVPVPVSLGFTATVVDLPTFVKDPLGVVGTEPMTFALNIDPIAPVFRVSLGTPNNVTFLKPLKAINNGQFQDQLTVDFAELNFAPFGGKIGEIPVQPGINVQFDGTIAGTQVNAKLQMDPATLTIQGKLLVGQFKISGATVQQTDLSVVLTPTKFDMTIKGGIALPENGPVANIDGHLIVQAAATDPIRLDLVANATNWTISPGNTFSTFRLEAHGGLTSLAAQPNLALAVTANGTVLGTPLTLGGAVVFTTNEMKFLGLQVNPGTMNVAGTTISGAGCTKQIAVPAGITGITSSALPTTTTSGVCVQLSYAKATTAPATIAVALNGKLTTAGLVASVAGSVDATGLAFTGSLAIPQFQTTINGRLFSGDAAALAAVPAAERPRNADNVAVAPLTGDWRLAGSFAPTGAMQGTNLTLIGGRVGGAEFVKGSGALVIGGQALANGSIAFTQTQMTLEGGLVLPLPPKAGQTTTTVSVNVNGTAVYPTATTGLDVTFRGDVAVAGGGVTSNASADFHYVERKGQTTDRLDFDGTATNWPLSSGTVIKSLVVGFHADIPKTGLAANASASVAAKVDVLAKEVNLNGSGTMVGGVVKSFNLQAGTEPILVGTTTISGTGCAGATSTGPCVQLNYAAGPPLVAEVKVNGTLITPGLTSTFNGTAGTNGVTFTGSTTMPTGDNVTVNGTIVGADGSGLTVIKANPDGTETTVPAVKGDVSFGGTWTPSGLLSGSNLAVRSGIVSGVGFGHAKGTVVAASLSLGNGRVTFTNTGSTVVGNASLPLPALPGCAALAGTAPLNLSVSGAFSATELILTGSQGQPSCADAPSIEGRIEARRVGTTNTLLLKGTAKNWTFGPTKLIELSASVSAANATTATLFTKASLLGAEVQGNGTATVVGGRVKAFALSASSAPIVLSSVTTLEDVAGVNCGPTALGGPCFTVDFDSARVAADQLRATFGASATVSGLVATLSGAVGNGQVTVEGKLDTGQFGVIDVVGSLFTATPSSRQSTISKDGVNYNLAAIATASGANINSAVKGDFVLGVKGNTPRSGAITGFPVTGLLLDAGRIGSVAWVHGKGSAAIGDSSMLVEGTVFKVPPSSSVFVNFRGEGNLVVNGFTLASATVDINRSSASLSGRVTVPNPAGGPAFVDVTLDGDACMRKCPRLFTSTQVTAGADDPPSFFFDLSGTASLRVSGFSAAGDFRLSRTTAAASFSFSGSVDTSVLSATLNGSVTKAGSVVSVCASGAGLVKTNGTDPSGTITFCSNPAAVTVSLDRGDFHFTGSVTSTSVSLDALANGVWIAADWHSPCDLEFALCRDRVDYTLRGKLRFSSGNAAPSFSVEGSGSAKWSLDRRSSATSSLSKFNNVFRANVSFSTSPLQVCVNIGGNVCSPTLG